MYLYKFDQYANEYNCCGWLSKQLDELSSICPVDANMCSIGGDFVVIFCNKL